jgi:hypothetical protein
MWDTETPKQSGRWRLLLTNAPWLPSIPNEDAGFYAGLFQNRPKCSFGHVSRVVGNRCVRVGSGVEPDFVTAGGLAIKLEAARLRLVSLRTISR